MGAAIRRSLRSAPASPILLVDFAIEEMRAGKDHFTALLEAGHKRARPIVMTTVAMIAGMLPTVVGIHGDNSFRAPMAVAVIGRLLRSTALTLVAVPTVFTLIDDVERWLGPKVGRPSPDLRARRLQRPLPLLRLRSRSPFTKDRSRSKVA